MLTRPDRHQRTRGPVEVKHPSGTVAQSIGHVLRSPRPMTWGRFVVKHGAVRWDVDANGFVWFVYTGEFVRLAREVAVACVDLGWGHSGSECFVRLTTPGVALHIDLPVATY